MKIMGIDISSKSTGWGTIQDNKLLEFGKINPTGTMTSAQKLFYFHNELERIIFKQKPDIIAIEDVVQVKSVSVAKILARFNGVAIVEAYRYLQKDPIMFEPVVWKKIITGNGAAKKCEIQLRICEIYNLLPEEKIEFYKIAINNIKKQINETIKIDLKDLKKQFKKSKNIEIQKQIDNIKLQNINLLKLNKKNALKLFDEISMKIYTESSINEDIADAIGAALAYQIQSKN